MEHQPDIWEVEKRGIVDAGFEPSDRALLSAVKAYTGCDMYRESKAGCPCEARQEATA